MNWHKWCPMGCKGREKPHCEFWGKTPREYVLHLREEIKNDSWWKGRGGFYVSTNGLTAGPKGQSPNPVRITLDNKLVDIFIPDLSRIPISVNTSDLRRVLYEGFDKQDPEIQRMLSRRITRMDVHRLVCYWYEIGKEWGHELYNLPSSRSVHHADRCRLNNRTTNLYPLTTLAHRFVHKKKGIPLPIMIDYLKAEDERQERLLARMEDMVKFFDD